MPPKRPFSASGDDQASSLGSASAADTIPAVGPAVPAAAVDAQVAAPAAASVPPASPGRNRALFLATVTPQHMTCDLTNAIVGLGVKRDRLTLV